MRTPGHDDLLARGLLFCEGVIEDNDDIEKLTQSTWCRERSEELVNLVDVTLHDSASIPAHLWERSLISNSSCGLCGKSSVEAMTAHVGALPESGALPQEVLWSLNGQMRERQALFQQTGGLHAAGIFSARGECLALFEDIGRHNATDKAIGFGLLNDWLPWNQPEPAVLFVSGRASFEIVQKALRARLPIVASVSAASSLAVDLAVAHNLTLLGFLRERGCTIYAGAQRITADE
jgi:FdhD protein